MSKLLGPDRGGLEVIVIGFIVVVVVTVLIEITVQVYTMDLKEGTVVDRRYHPSYVTYHESGGSTFPVKNPEAYYLIIEGETMKGVFKRRVVQVPEHTYHNTTNGAWFHAP